MKKIVLVYGLISGLIIGIWTMISMAYFHNSNSYQGSMLVGYTAMFLALSFVYVGVRKFRDEENEGNITFSKALQIALSISFLASTIYVIAWLIDYYVFLPDFMDQFAVHYLEEIKNSGATAAEISAKTTEINSMKELYKNPVMVVLFTYLEILPVGVVVSIVSALVLRKQNSPDPTIPLR